MSSEVLGPVLLSSENRAARNGGESISEANARWLLRVVRPTFELFAIRPEVRALGPIVTSTHAGCQLEIGTESGPRGKFDACIGVAGPGSDRLDVRLPGIVRHFEGTSRDEVNASMVHSALSLAFREWHAGRS